MLDITPAAGSLPWSGPEGSTQDVLYRRLLNLGAVTTFVLERIDIVQALR